MTGSTAGSLRNSRTSTTITPSAASAKATAAATSQPRPRSVRLRLSAARDEELDHEVHDKRGRDNPGEPARAVPTGPSPRGSVGGGSNRRRGGLASPGVPAGSGGSKVSMSTVLGSGASTVCVPAGSAYASCSGSTACSNGSSSSTALSSRSKRLGHLPHVRHEFATGSLIVPHCEHRQGAVAIVPAYGSSRSRDLDLVHSRAVLGRELEDEQRPVLLLLDDERLLEAERAARAGAGGRGREVPGDYLSVLVQDLEAERRLERVRRPFARSGLETSPKASGDSTSTEGVCSSKSARVYVVPSTSADVADGTAVGV